jgi:hypothetical protein
MLPNMPGVRKSCGLRSTVWIVEHGTHADRARARVEAVVGEVQLAVPAIGRLVLEADLYVGGVLVLGLLALGLEEQRFGGIEREVDRADGIDRGQQRGAGAVLARDEVAHVHAAVGDPARDRRADGGELDVERTLAHASIGGGQRGSGSADLGAKLVDFAGGHGLVTLEPGDAGIVGLGKDERALGGGHFGLRLGQ